MPDAPTPYQAIIAAPGFALGVACDETALHQIEFLEAQPEQAPINALAETAVHQIKAYLADPTYAFNLPLKPAGTPFQQRVWAEIARIPLGHVHTYGQLAARLHNAPRAVGQACGANPYPLVVPCHRVVAASGLGGFNQHSAGFLLDVKRWLLAHEGMPLAHPPR